MCNSESLAGKQLWTNSLSVLYIRLGQIGTKIGNEKKTICGEVILPKNLSRKQFLCCCTNGLQICVDLQMFEASCSSNFSSDAVWNLLKGCFS